MAVAELGAPTLAHARVRVRATTCAPSRVVWQREMIRFSRDRLRVVTSLIQPVLFLFVLGSGLSTLTSGTIGNLNLKTFMFPGALSMAVLFTALFSAASIVWDREFGFLREMLVAPISRWSIVVGKCLGGATTASLQGVLILLMAGLVGVPYSFSLFMTVLGELVLLALTLDRVRRHDRRAHPAVPGLHGAQPDAADAAVLPVRRAVPAARAADLAARPDPDRPDHLRRRPRTTCRLRAPQRPARRRSTCSTPA